MPTRNCETRPISWKTHRNKALANAVVKMGQYYGDLRKGFVVWPVWMGMLTHRDNIGYFDGAVGIMRDSFFPHHPEITPEEVRQARDLLHEEGLIICYKVNGIEYILVPKVSNWSRLVGNISDKTDFPLPPEDVIREWEQRFNEVYTPLIRCKDVVSPESKSKNKSKIERYIKDIEAFFSSIDLNWLKQIKKTYPKVNLEDEFNKMHCWLISNTDYPKKNLKRFVVNWLNRPNKTPSESQGKNRLSSIEIDKQISAKLGNIATKDMIKALMRDIPQNLWWKIDKFIKHRYSGSDGKSFIDAEREITEELRENQDKFKSLVGSIFKKI